MIYEALKKYRDINISLIEALNIDDLDKVEKLLEKKDELINFIDNMEYSKEDFIKFSKELDIMKSEEMLNKVSNLKKQEYKKEMSKVNNTQKAYKSYNSNFRGEGYFIKQKI
ncbi:hypothetical protein FDF74_01435 [Clostridium niameyense]|uniref:Flagellar protein FliT n=1 Tax=Clostridium niameyense TaxID=1622073 RepID=A0A6M0R851_9CLOT|nr:hypothetical protein [Clostridium niameyense]NEZ45870.1 hypothetical protein [Clostridium niameyense]